LNVGMHANFAGSLTTHPAWETRPDGVSSSIPLVAVPLARSSLILWQAKWFTTMIPPFATLATDVNHAHAERTNTNRVAFMGASLRRKRPRACRVAYNVRDVPTSTKNSGLVRSRWRCARATRNRQTVRRHADR